MSMLAADPHVDAELTRDVLVHLSAQLDSARRMLAIVLEQATAIRQRAIPQVTMLIGINAAPVFLARTAGNGVVDAKRPKNGVQSPLSPAC